LETILWCFKEIAVYDFLLVFTGMNKTVRTSAQLFGQMGKGTDWATISRLGAKAS
jgi:hypothetical protein